jgi:hypothetical protein
MEQSLPTKACSFWQERGSNIFPGVFLSGPFYFQRPMPVSQMGSGFAGSQWLCCSPFGSITGSLFAGRCEWLSVRKQCVFLLLGQHFVEKNGPMQPGKFMGQGY